MGFDMWLPSIFDFNDEKHHDLILDRVVNDPVAGPVKPIDRIEQYYDACRATGGYYREGYNGRGLLTIMGLSWSEIVGRLEDRRLLPPAHARHLLAELEARPITKAMVLGEERRPDPMVNWVTQFSAEMQDMIKRETGREEPPEAPPTEQEIERARLKYVERRKQLMALLRAAIERDEPLHISS
jgi:hypothetical protein